MTAAYCAIWMQDTSIGWLMTEMKASPTTIALLQMTTSLPIFFLALPGGVMGDRFDRRKILIGVQAVLSINAAIITLATLGGWADVTVFLFVNAIAGSCLALSSPVRHALTPILVDRSALVGAVTLNSIGFNAARLIGPAIAGGIIALGSATYSLAAGSCILCLVSLVLAFCFKLPERSPSPAGVSLLQAAGDGARLAASDTFIRKTLLTLLFYSSFAGVVFTLLPLIMTRQLGAQEATYGFGMASLGAGAILGGISLSRTMRGLSMKNVQLIASTMVFLGLVVIGATHRLEIGMLGFLVCGAGWVITLSTLNAQLQLHVEDAFRARVTSLALMSNALGLAVASPAWGYLVERTDIATAMFVAAILVVLLTITRFVLRGTSI
jgi:predicted MFS family arabinose efflux permease